MNIDIINGMFELFGAPFICLSIYDLYKKKKVRGVSWIHVSYFAVWGYWNLYYYPCLEQWASFVGTITIVAANTVWLGQLLYYSHKERANDDGDAGHHRNDTGSSGRSF